MLGPVLNLVGFLKEVRRGLAERASGTPYQNAKAPIAVTIFHVGVCGHADGQPAITAGETLNLHPVTALRPRTI